MSSGGSHWAAQDAPVQPEGQQAGLFVKVAADRGVPGGDDGKRRKLQTRSDRTLEKECKEALTHNLA